MFGDGNGFIGLKGLFFVGGADNSPAVGSAYQGVYSASLGPAFLFGQNSFSSWSSAEPPRPLFQARSQSGSSIFRLSYFLLFLPCLFTPSSAIGSGAAGFLARWACWILPAERVHSVGGGLHWQEYHSRAENREIHQRWED
jgi:Amt family ammonium transporter